MKTFNKILGVTAAFLLTCAGSTALGAPAREHRALWMTPFLGSNWPSSAITAGNATSTKNILHNRLAKFKDQNINIIYYHCRAMCDATYDSKYEPWSKNVSGTRGVAPAFDPFGYLVEEAHAVGIEVYAWINPYRYCSSTSYGAGELNYENSHPEWLLVQSKETILNPALEEVKQRIVDVVMDILDKYDVDGVVFDDYFYTNGTPMSLDAADYQKYTSAGGKMSQADWRRANINDMVHRVNAAIKAKKPYVTFGIGPAGVSSPTNVETEYGLTPAPGGGDWQYNGIYSDPLAWLKAGDIDYISPQIYWPSRFDALSQWWYTAATKFNRHCYPSVDLSEIGTTYKYSEWAREIDVTRQYAPAGTSGIVFFQYANYVNYSEKVDGKNTAFGDILAQDAWNTKALVPLRPWIKSTAPAMVKGVKLDGTTLSWTGNAAGRYAIYKMPKNQSSVALTLDGISYADTYTAANAADYNWYVAAYDRYGNVSAPLGVGATATTGTAPRLTYPVNGQKPVDLFDFTWEHQSTLKNYTVEVARDAAFTDMVGVIPVEGDLKASVAGLPTLQEGQTYHWRVKATDVNCEHPVSASATFVASRLALDIPQAGVAISPLIKWSAAADGAEYTLEIARTVEMTNPVHTAVTTAASYQVPACVLNSGRQYYARVTATKDGATSTSDVVAFTTVNRTDYAAPVFVNPSQNGQKIYSDQTVKVAPWEGMTGVTVQIAASNTFPTRTSYTTTLSDFATETPELGTAKISSKNLVDGTTYYLRARGTYALTTSTANQYTDYSPTYTFVYSAEAGVTDLTADNEGTYLLNGTSLKVGKGVNTVTVYTIAGATVATYAVNEGDTLSFENLVAGTYLVTAGNTTFKLVK